MSWQHAGASIWRESACSCFSDNAHDEQQVLPFLPGGPGHIVLVTSRRTLRGLVITEGAIAIDLPVFAPDEAVALIERIVGHSTHNHERNAAEAIAEFCGYHPYAMAIAIVGMVNNPRLTLARRLAQLEAVPSRLLAIDQYADEEGGTVAKVFELSYMDLPDKSRRVLRRLGLTPVPEINIEVAAAITGLRPIEVQTHLRRLAADRLIEDDGDEYHLHDLIRQFALGLAERDDPDANAAAISAVLAYYCDAAKQTDVMLTRQPPPPSLDTLPPTITHRAGNMSATIGWARYQLDNFLACADYAEQETSSTWVIRFAATLAGLLRNDGLWPRSVDLQTRAIRAARQLGIPLAEANALHERAQLHRLLGNLREATEDLERALSLYRGVGGTEGRTGEAHVLNSYAVVLDQRKLPGAAARLIQALALYRALADGLGEANVRHDQGMAELYAKRYAQAAERLQQALTLYKSVDHPLGKAHAYANLARAQREIGRIGEAAGNLERAIETYRQLGNVLGEANTLIELGVLLRNVGNQESDRSAEVLATAVELCEKVGNWLGHARSLHQLGALRGAAGDLVAAERLLTRSYEIYHQHGILRDEAEPVNELKALGLWPGDASDADSDPATEHPAAE